MLIDQIARETGFGQSQIIEILRRAPHAYCVYSIPKRNGIDRRQIAHPSRSLKVLQRWLAERVLIDLPIHDSVYSYREGRSIQDHARIHANTNFLLRVDLRDFFPSISRNDVLALLRRWNDVLRVRLSEEDRAIVARLVCKGTTITIGSPSSPVISNAVLYDFDIKATEIAAQHQAIYTRYADDLYFSTDTPNVLSNVYEDVRIALRSLPFPKVTINEDKVVFTSRKRQKVVTGLVITHDRKISIGHDKKRYIRGLLHRFGEGKLDAEKISYLKGYLSFCRGSEPEFMSALQRKYGESLLAKLFKEPTVQRKITHRKRTSKNLI